MAIAVESARQARTNWILQTPSSEDEFVRQLQAGDELAYRGLVDRYQKRILRLAHGILRNWGEAEEVTQAVFLKVFLSVKNFAGRSSLFAWVHRITVNECYSLLRKNGLSISVETQDSAGVCSGYLQEWRRPGPSWEAVVLQRDYLNSLLAKLPDPDRHLLLLREVEGLSMAELAEATGLDENLVKLKLYRARQRLVKLAGFARGAKTCSSHMTSGGVRRNIADSSAR